MWAGSQFEFRSPVRVGDGVERLSTIEDVTSKTGRSGALVFVKVRHELRCNGAAEPALVEWHDIVYREAKPPGAAEPPPQPAPQGADWQREIVPDDVLLFRYSALTFNGHRIHYDRRYATAGRGLSGPGGAWPADRHAAAGPAAPRSCRRPTWRPSASAPCGRPSTGSRSGINGARDGLTVRLWAQDHEGWLTMDAVATLRA